MYSIDGNNAYDCSPTRNRSLLLRSFGCTSFLSRRGKYLEFTLLLHGRITYYHLQLYLQSTFHRPLAYPLPYPPRPIFTRLRPPTAAEIEAGHESMTYETSFYKNAWAMVRTLCSLQSINCLTPPFSSQIQHLIKPFSIF